MADVDVATPFSVPRTRRLDALFVSRIVEQGNAKIEPKHFSTITKNRNPQIDTAHIHSWMAKHNTCCVSTQLTSKFTSLQRNTPHSTTPQQISD